MGFSALRGHNTCPPAINPLGTTGSLRHKNALKSHCTTGHYGRMASCNAIPIHGLSILSISSIHLCCIKLNSHNRAIIAAVNTMSIRIYSRKLQFYTFRGRNISRADGKLRHKLSGGFQLAMVLPAVPIKGWVDCRGHFFGI